RRGVMALVSCPECGKQVSSDAPSCPHCGKVLSGGTAAGSAGSGAAGVLSPPTTPPPAEQQIWEGSPSVALVYGQGLRLLLRAVGLFIIGYLVINVGLPAVGSISADAGSAIEQNASVIDWIIIGVLALTLLPPLVT